MIQLKEDVRNETKNLLSGSPFLIIELLSYEAVHDVFLKKQARFAERIEKNGLPEPPRLPEQELRDLFFDALDFFNEAFDSGITRDNTVLAFFTLDNGMEVYEQFCREHFSEIHG